MSEHAVPGSNPASAPAANGEAILRLLNRPVSSADLEASSRLAAHPGDSSDGRSARFLLFRIGAEAAALPAQALRRVTPVARPSPIPHRTTGVLRGVCNIRGELVLCADLHRLLGLPARDAAPHPDLSTDLRRMVVMGPADDSWAFEVDALLGVESADPGVFRAAPATVGYSIADFTIGVTDIGGRCVTVLNGERVLAGFKASLA